MNNPNLKYKKFIVYTLVIGLIFISCSKDKGEYYSYENKDSKYEGTIYQYLVESNNGKFDSMSSLLKKVNLLDTLNSADSITVIAFTNTSFNNAMESLNTLRKSLNKLPLSIAGLDSASIDTLISRYIIPSYLPVDSIIPYSDGRTVGVLHYPDYTMNFEYSKQAAEGIQNQGPQQLTVYDMKNSLNNSSWVGNITQAVDIRAKNGIIHILEDGHEFGFSDASTVLNKN